MKAVSRFETDLVRLLHALLGRAPIEAVAPTIAARQERPACLSPAAVDLIRDSLAKGYAWRLARAGGWRRDRTLRDGRAASGRLWERSTAEDLAPSFSGQSLEFLLWLASDDPGDRPSRWEPDSSGLSVGDLVFLLFAYEAIRPTGFGPTLRTLASFRDHGLCRLAFPDDFADNRGRDTPDMTRWASGPGAAVVEALGPWLGTRWAEIEEARAGLADPAALGNLAASQESVCDAFLGAVDAAGRRDLTRFLLDAADAAIGPGRRGKDRFHERAMNHLRLADRAALRRFSLVLFRAVGRLGSWEREARDVGYFDEGYDAAQLWKSDWEARGGGDLADRAAALVREADPLGAPAGNRDQQPASEANR